MPVILSTQEAKVGRITVSGQLGKKFARPCLNRKSWVWWCEPVIPATAGIRNRRIVVQTGPGKKRDPISKITRAKRAGGVTQGIESLASKQKMLSRRRIIYFSRQKRTHDPQVLTGASVTLTLPGIHLQYCTLLNWRGRYF
jgi:hypothetical protein